MSTQQHLQIVSVERIDGTEAIIEFSDGTYAIFTTEELVLCAKDRRPMEERNGGEGK